MAYQKSGPAKGDVHPLIQWIWLKMKEDRITHEHMAKKAGLTPATLRNWARGRTEPKLADVDAVITILGFDLSVKRIPQED